MKRRGGDTQTTAQSQENDIIFMKTNVYLLLDQTFQRALWESPALHGKPKHLFQLYSNIVKYMKLIIIKIVIIFCHAPTSAEKGLALHNCLN